MINTDINLKVFLVISFYEGFMDRYLGSENEAAANAYAGIANEVSTLYLVCRGD